VGYEVGIGDGMVKKEEDLKALVERLKKEKAEYEEYVERQTTSLTETISSVASGDFSVSAKYEREDELGALAEGINTMIGELRKTHLNLEKALEESKRAEERLKNSHQKLRFIYEGSKELALVFELTEIYNRSLDLACRALGADGGSLMAFDEKTREVVVVAAAGSRKEIVMGKRLKLGERFAGRAAKLMNAVFMHEVEEEPWYKELHKFEVIKSGMSVPLVVRGKLVGVLNLKRTEKEEKFTKDDVEFAALLGSYVAAAIERARLHNELVKSKDQLEKMRTKLEEKVRELEEFHDLVVGRELKMKEMEAELERLKARLGEK
jgi:nitrate/nitrite-specific signal transduction histidine kinase